MSNIRFYICLKSSVKLQNNNAIKNKNGIQSLENGEEKKTVKVQEVMEKLGVCTDALNKQNKELSSLGIMKAQTEKSYRTELAHEILRLREEKHPATLILELAKGSEQVAELRCKRDIAKDSYYACVSAIENLRLEIDTTRSLLVTSDK